MKQKRLIIRSIILVVMFAAIGYTLISHFTEDRGRVDRDDIAPNFAVVDTEGNLLELADLEGKGVYVNFWATWCSVCRDKMEHLKNNYDDYRDKGVVIVAINSGEGSTVIQRHMERFQYNYPLYIDRGNLVGNAYGVMEIPVAFLIDENGVVLDREIGPKSEEKVIQSLERLIPGN
ncbi:MULTISPECIES: thiol-disulfide oxidoreductase ResA [Bacillaceae]|uniref:Thiol-disulfide oxidoreductase ResA n=1 Tax=Evansella alkalicola TaxID=745819 RepID=A0ABS6K129_9BACI|nr:MULTISPECIES: thiol-disulfide oxidoreductase ResA [Bacillaceae]MBU9724006.1 thiol-disulfide oxidoreductase ResA [Bacillus alkalicola]